MLDDKDAGPSVLHFLMTENLRLHGHFERVVGSSAIRSCGARGAPWRSYALLLAADISCGEFDSASPGREPTSQHLEERCAQPLVHAESQLQHAPICFSR